METTNTIKYEPNTKVFAVIYAFLFPTALDILVVPINSSFKNILLFMPITRPIVILFNVNKSLKISLIMLGNKSMFLKIVYKEIDIKNIVIIGTSLFSIFLISSTLLVINKVTRIIKIKVNNFLFINNVFIIVFVCIIRKKILYVVIKIINISMASLLFFRPFFV